MSIEFTPNPVVHQPATGGEGARIPPDITAVGLGGEGNGDEKTSSDDARSDESDRLYRMFRGQTPGTSILDVPPRGDIDERAAKLLKGIVDTSDS